MNNTIFLEMFPCCAGLIRLCGGLDQALVAGVELHRERMTMNISAEFAKPPKPDELSALEDCIAAEYELSAVTITPLATITPSAAITPPVNKDFAAPASETAMPAVHHAKPPSKNSVLLGKPIKSEPAAMSGITRDSGTVTIRGEVFAVNSRIIQKRDSAVISFDVTDYTGSVRVSKYTRDAAEMKLIDKIKPGMYLTVKGHAAYNRYDDDIVLEPTDIMTGEKAKRQDTAADKRVELHLHTRFSALDGLTSPAAAVERAAAWGHSAIAFTDHGVAQSFPDVWKAGKKFDIKIIYGIEGYYINDVDDQLSVSGRSDRSLDDEFIAFDLETTGLDAKNDRITEIGAVVMKNGKMGERFQTFVNPERPIPREITELTGITDRDVYDAPSEQKAVTNFLRFVRERPLIAHNAPFDIGFIEASCERLGLEFNPVFLDTLTLSRNLLPDLRRHKLNLVSDRLGLPGFSHHRASDDACVVARIMEKFIPMLNDLGVTKISEIEAGLERKTAEPAAKPKRAGHIILLVKNKTGLKNLYRLISASHLEHFHKNPIIPKSLLMKHRDGLIIGSACASGEVFDGIVRNRGMSELKRIAGFYDFLEIQPLCNNAFLIGTGAAKDEEQLREYNRRVLALAKELNKPCCATGDVHFLDPEHEIYRKIILSAKKFADADRDLPIYLKTTDEMLDEFAYLGREAAYEAVVKAPNAIADMCESFDLLPKKLFTPTIENSAADLEKLVREKILALYGENPPETVKTRADTELSDIISCKYDVIYMSAQKLVANSLAAGYLVGSRGSVGSSLIAYLSGITEVNSLPAHYRCAACKYSDFDSGKNYGCGADMPDKLCPVCGEKLIKDGFDIPFETFLGFGGDKIPDIDLNFSGEYQARAHKYTEELFGRDHVFRAGTIGTLAEKTAYGYVKKYLEEQGKIVTRAEEARLSLGCVGIKRTTGQHPGGLVIIPQDMDVNDFCPVQHPADDKDSGIITTHFEYHSMEQNLLKLDELGHDDPTMIKTLEDLTGVNAREIPLDDPDTMSIFKSPKILGLPENDPVIGKTGTIGIPEFGTGFTRSMLVDTQPSEFDTLVRLSGFSHGTDVWLGNAKDLILSGTADIKQTIGCRDDIMLYLISMGMEERNAFKIMESVRKGKGVTDDEAVQMQKIDVPDWYVDSCRKIKYLFPKAHAVAYVMMAFRIAWFKVHRPLEFYSAYFYRRSQKDSFDASVMINGIEPVKTKINNILKSQNPTAKEEDLLTTLEAVYEFYLRGYSFGGLSLYSSDAAKFIVSGNTLIPPFITVPGLGELAAMDLVRARDGGRSFVSVEELMAACPKLNQTNAELLKSAGALGNMPESSQLSLF